MTNVRGRKMRRGLSRADVLRYSSDIPVSTIIILHTLSSIYFLIRLSFIVSVSLGPSMEKETSEYSSPTGIQKNMDIVTPCRGASAATERSDAG